jgi:PAS domain S-box-containing protein
MPIGMALSKGGVYVQANAAFLKLFGHELEAEIIGRPLLDHVAASQRDFVRGMNQKRELTGSGPMDYESLGRRKDGSTFPIHIKVAAVPLAEGTGTLAFITDISERKEFEARLLRSEEIFRTYVEQSIDVIFTLDPQGCFTFVSNAWERHFGFPASAVVGQYFAPYVHPEDIEPCLKYLLRVMATGQSETSPRYRVRHADGSWRWFEANGSVLYSLAGGPLFLGVAHAIPEVPGAQVELQRNEGELKQQHGLLSSLLKLIPMGIFMVEAPSGRPLVANEAALALLGRGILPGASAQNLAEVYPAYKVSSRMPYPPSEMPIMLGMQGLASHVDDLVVVRPDGTERRLEIFGTPVTDEEGMIWASLVSFLDITERKHAETALKESEEQIRVIFEASDAGIILVSDQGRITFANQRMAEMFGMSMEALIGTTYPEHLDPTEQQVADTRMRMIITGEIQSVSVERKFLRADGSTFWGHLSGRRLEHPDRSLHTLVGIITDVSKRREAEEQQHFLEAQLHQAQKMESLGALAGGVAHDMNNVLGAILGLASAHIEAQPVGSQTQKAFGTIIKAAERGGNLLKSLLSFARQNAAEDQDLDVNAILREEVRLLERTTLSKVRLVMDLDPDLRLIRGDGGALTHAFMNLCVNAVDAMDEQGTLTLMTRSLGPDWIEVQVQDTGTGMSKEIMERALDPFFTTKEVGKGTGLGLSIVYRTVKAHQGEMELQSEPGLGTAVIMRFPSIKEPARPVELSGAYQTLPWLSSISVLLVDDDELIQGSIQGMLERMGHQTTLAKSGEEALAMLKSGLKPDVIILDMNMPGLGGAGTLPRLRASHPRLPVLLATGRADQTAQDLVKAYDCVTLLPKPFGMKELQAQLDPHLGC